MNAPGTQQNSSAREDLIYLKKCRHGTFALLQNDLISYATQLYGEWAEQELELFKTIVSEGSVIFEIGAHIGTLTIPLARLAGETGKVYAFEPQVHPFQALNANILLNAQRTVRAYPFAVAAHKGTIRLKHLQFEHSVNSGAFVLRDHVQADGEWTELVTLDMIWNAVNRPAVRLLKVDVEGMEPDVWKGALECIRETKPIVFMESNFWKFPNGDGPGDAFYASVQSEGYALFWYCTKGFRKNNFFKATENILGQGGDINVVAYPKGELPKKRLQPFINCNQIRSGAIQWIE